MSSGKSLCLVFVVMALSLSLFSSDVWGKNLVQYYSQDDGTVFYYDKTRLKKISGGKLRVWTKIIYGVDSKNIKNKKSSYEGKENLFSSRSFYEIDCKEKRYRLITFTDYDVNGKVLYTHPENLDSHWKHIVPVSILEELKNKVCK